MNLKKFEFVNKDVPSLKKDIATRLTFTVLFVGILIWQFVSFLITHNAGNMTIGKIISTVFVLLLALILGMLGFVYTFKDFRIVTAIKKRGSCVSTVDLLFSTKKDSFMKIYDIICQVLAYVSLFVLLCSLTSLILNAAFYSQMSYYMPLLFLLCAAGFNSVFHIKSEINTMKTVQQYHSFY